MKANQNNEKNDSNPIVKNPYNLISSVFLPTNYSLSAFGVPVHNVYRSFFTLFSPSLSLWFLQTHEFPLTPLRHYKMIAKD